MVVASGGAEWRPGPPFVLLWSSSPQNCIDISRYSMWASREETVHSVSVKKSRKLNEVEQNNLEEVGREKKKPEEE